MEQVLPGADPEDFDSDPIVEANELRDNGHIARAKKLLERLSVEDVPCLDAHAHLGDPHELVGVTYQRSISAIWQICGVSLSPAELSD
jgi:hypothetical protein